MSDCRRLMCEQKIDGHERYLEWVKQNHPDNGGDGELFKRVASCAWYKQYCRTNTTSANRNTRAPSYPSKYAEDKSTPTLGQDGRLWIPRQNSNGVWKWQVYKQKYSSHQKQQPKSRPNTPSVHQNMRADDKSTSRRGQDGQWYIPEKDGHGVWRWQVYRTTKEPLYPASRASDKSTPSAGQDGRWYIPEKDSNGVWRWQVYQQKPDSDSQDERVQDLIDRLAECEKEKHALKASSTIGDYISYLLKVLTMCKSRVNEEITKRSRVPNKLEELKQIVGNLTDPFEMEEFVPQVKKVLELFNGDHAEKYISEQMKSFVSAEVTNRAHYDMTEYETRSRTITTKEKKLLGDIEKYLFETWGERISDHTKRNQSRGSGLMTKSDLVKSVETGLEKFKNGLKKYTQNIEKLVVQLAKLQSTQRDQFVKHVESVVAVSKSTLNEELVTVAMQKLVDDALAATKRHATTDDDQRAVQAFEELRRRLS